MKNPLALVTEKFGDKKKLVEAVEAFAKKDDLWLKRPTEGKGIEHISNAKLLRLHATFTAVKEKFGTREKLVVAILELDKRAKDEGYKTRLLGYPVPRLFDLYNSTAKRHAPKSEKKAAAAKKPAAAKKAAAPAKAKAAPKAKAKK
ncbi:MAG: hypothetical protein ABI461_00970 [Polyangiaceae bacterium]